MASTMPGAALEKDAVPRLTFVVQDAGPVEHAAVPTLRLALRIDGEGPPIRSILLDVQVQIAARRRPYDRRAEERLVDLFGTADRWGDSLRTLPWTRSTLVVPPFEGSTIADLQITCSYDLEVTASRYLHALEDGEVPLELLFSGTIFYSMPDGRLQTVRIPWSGEAQYDLPVRVWRETMDAHFPNAAWLRLDRESFDRLNDYKARRSLPNWEKTLDSLLDAAGDD
jgi:hypothetical protein